MRAVPLAAMLVAVLLTVPAGVADAKRVRVFAVGPKIEPAWLVSKTAYRSKLLALTDARERPAAAAAGVVVQEDADDVASHLFGPSDPQRPVQTARDLVTLPEDVGLLAAFTGQQGATARGATDITTAIVGLLGTYTAQSAYYQARFPQLGTRPFPPTRLLAVALTDTFAHVAVETFAELADRTDAYVVAGVNMARDWRIVCQSKATYEPPPGGGACEQENPLKVAALRAPEDVARTYAYEATSPDPVNMALVFDPQGRLISKQVKAYLTPVELPGSLDLKPGAVSGLVGVDTAVGRLGIVTSKDAWMPDVTTKLDQDHVEVLVQPEFFVGDTIRSSGPWAPDTIRASGYSDVLRHPSIGALVLPEMTGNLFDFSADNQQAIMVKPRSARATATALLGQSRQPGLVAVSPWVAPDPLTRTETLLQRRTRLAAAGEKLLPGSGVACPAPAKPGACENGHVEGVLFADVQVAQPRPFRPQKRKRRARGRAFTASVPLARADAVQRNVALAARGQSVWAAFEERRGTRDQIVLARSTTEGARFGGGVRPTGRPAGAANEWWPSVSAGPDGAVWVAWQDDSSGTWRAYVARSADGGRTFGPPLPVDATPAAGVKQWKPQVAATGPGRAVVAWIDERGRFGGDDLAQAQVRLARIEGDAVAPSVRVDDGLQPVPLAATLDHAWAPSLAVSGERVLVSWIDFRSYDWRVSARESADGGATFGPEQVLTATPGDVEALDDTPRAAYAQAAPNDPVRGLVAHTRWRKEPEGLRTPSRLYDTVLASLGGPAPVQADDHGGDQVSTFSPALATLPGGDVLIAWQDHAKGPGDIFLARMRGAAAGTPVRRPAVRVDDSGTAGTNQWRPQVALTANRVVVAWEDERDGPAQIYVARAAPRRVG